MPIAYIHARQLKLVRVCDQQAAAAAAAQNVQNAGVLGAPRHGSAAGVPRGRTTPGSFGLGVQQQPQQQQQQRTNPGFGQAMQVTAAAACRSESGIALCTFTWTMELSNSTSTSVTRDQHSTAAPADSWETSSRAMLFVQLQGVTGRSSSGLLGEGGAAAYIRRAQSSPGGYSHVNGSTLDQQQQVQIA